MITPHAPGAPADAALHAHVAKLRAAGDALVQRFRDDDAVRAIIAVGSFANGTCDRHSDLDLHFVVHREGAREFFSRLREGLAELGPVTAQTVLQGTYSLRHVIVFYRSGVRIDAHLSLLDQLRLTEPPLVLLDREGVMAGVEPVPARREPAALARLADSFLLALSDVAKVLQRGERYYAVFRALQVVHMTAMLHRALVDPESMESGMKRLERAGLPDTVMARFARVLELLHPGTAAAGALAIADLAADALRQHEPSLESPINWEYFDVIRGEIADAASSADDRIAAVAAG